MGMTKMAAPMQRLSFCVMRFNRQSFQRLNGQSLVQKARTYSSDQNGFSNKNFKVGLSEDENTIICWHPEPKFPYEHTKPLPRKESEIREGDTALKLQYMKEYRLQAREDGPTEKELANIFHTSKHRWYQSTKKKYLRPKVLKDREGL